jgi:NADH dehydrogenase/NADH:ubiquinone oxidoreductase subunit G
MRIKINGKIYEAKEGEMIHSVLKRSGIRVPTLCSLENFQEGLCRICVVEISGKLVTSCNTSVSKEMKIETESENVQKARKINLELLWADHAGKCVTCKKNRMCELQKLAEEYRIENFHFVPRKGEMTSREELDLVRDNWSRVVVEDENPCVSRNSEFCVECRRCINVCPEKKFGMNYRAGDVVVGTPYEKVLDCSFCGACVEACPVAALTDQNDYVKIFADLDDLQKFSVAVLDVEMEKKILEKMRDISTEKNVDKILRDLGFEKIVKLEKEDEEDKMIEKIKTEEAKKEKINPEKIRVFFISSKIAKKKNKNGFLDYVLSEREVGRMVRDRKRGVIGKIGNH